MGGFEGPKSAVKTVASLETSHEIESARFAARILRCDRIAAISNYMIQFALRNRSMHEPKPNHAGLMGSDGLSWILTGVQLFNPVGVLPAPLQTPGV